MKAILNFRFVLICISTCFCSLNMYGQWDDYSSHTDKEYHNSSKSVYLDRFPNKQVNGFQVLVSVPTQPSVDQPIFQINTKGKMLLGSVLGTENTYLDFMQQDIKYGSINTYKEDFHVDAVRQLWLSSRDKTAMIVDGDNIDVFGNLNISLPGLTPKAKVSIYNGVNNAPTLSANQSDKWLRIGNAGGLALFGDDTYKQAEAVPTLKIIKDWLEIKGNLKVMDGDVISYVGVSSGNTDGWIGTASNHGLYIGSNNAVAVYVDPKQRVYVGLHKSEITTIRSELKEKYGLFVAKGILAEDYSIAPKNSWSDCVFNEYYNLKKLGDVEKFIKENKHLPDVPSAAEVAEKGYSQHEMNKVLLQKIEELTLYTIEQNKKIAELEEKLNSINK